MSAKNMLFPSEDQIFVCEIDGRLRSMPSETGNLAAVTNVVSRYPSVNVSRELSQSHTREINQQLFLPTRDPLSTRVISTWYQLGLRPALELLAEEGGGGPLAKGIKFVFTIIDKLYGSKFSNTYNSNNAYNPIRFFEWHPHTLTIAVAAWDDSIRIFSADASQNLILKTKMQRNVNAISWRPFTAQTLAVGCAEGIVIWSRDPNNKTSMIPSFLKSPDSAPVTCLSWDPQGTTLLSASSCNTDLYLWDITLEESIKLPKKVRNGTGLIAWSPSKLHLVTSSFGTAFHLWDTRSWTCDRWNVASGRIIAACYSPCGSYFLFTSTEEPLVFAISLRPCLNALFGSVSSTQQAAHLALDHSLTETDSGHRWGGLIKNMVWDPKGLYLAITSFETDLVTVFNTDIKETLTINPLCVINGKAGDKPNYIAFQPDFDTGAVLTIAWSSGKVQYFPFINSSQIPISNPKSIQDATPYLETLKAPRSMAPSVNQTSFYAPSSMTTATTPRNPPVQSLINATPQQNWFSPAAHLNTSQQQNASMTTSFFASPSASSPMQTPTTPQYSTPFRRSVETPMSPTTW